MNTSEDLISFGAPTRMTTPQATHTAPPFKAEPSAFPPLVAASQLMYMPEHKIVVKLVDKPYEEHAFEHTTTKVLV